QQSLLHPGTGAANLADVAHGLTVEAVAATTTNTRKSVGAVAGAVSGTAASHRVSNAPPARGRDDSSDRTHALNSTRSHETMSMLSRRSSSHSVSGMNNQHGHNNNNHNSSHGSSFDRSMVPAHKDYLARIGFGGFGRVIAFDGNMAQWRELAELTSLVVDQML
ncbi:hypothetical protein H4S06_005281, partial [Coemansia sp. BCRC 34490]